MVFALMALETQFNKTTLRFSGCQLMGAAPKPVPLQAHKGRLRGGRDLAREQRWQPDREAQAQSQVRRLSSITITTITAAVDALADLHNPDSAHCSSICSSAYGCALLIKSNDAV
jgi:hypothetical protein